MDVAAAIEARLQAIVDGMWATGTVTDIGPGALIVVDIAGSSMTLPKLASYNAPAIGDVVRIACPPGAWLVLGKPG